MQLCGRLLYQTHDTFSRANLLYKLDDIRFFVYTGNIKQQSIFPTMQQFSGGLTTFTQVGGQRHGHSTICEPHSDPHALALNVLANHRFICYDRRFAMHNTATNTSLNNRKGDTAWHRSNQEPLVRYEPISSRTQSQYVMDWYRFYVGYNQRRNKGYNALILFARTTKTVTSQYLKEKNLWIKDLI
jgi:hypothetical protein